ncbi:MAG: hypothetical protein R2912_10225 [Eubacteriales bacterium]
MLVDPYYDVFQYQYSVQNSLLEPIEHQSELNSGTFVPLYAAMNRALVLPNTEELIPFSKFDAGKLSYGISDPDSPAFNSLADFYAKDGVIELAHPMAAVQRPRPGHKEHHRRLEQDRRRDGADHRIVLVCRLFRPEHGYRAVWHIQLGKLGSADLSRAAEEELLYRARFVRRHPVISKLPYLTPKFKLRKGCDDT